MANLILNGSTSGSVTLSSPAVSGTTTLTLPTTTGTVVADTATQTLTNKTLTSPTITGATITVASTAAPAFSAYQSVAQSITANTFTKITFTTEEFDTNNNFASSRFTPTVAGYYQVSFSVTTAPPPGFFTLLYKNGVEYKIGTNLSNASPAIQTSYSGIGSVLAYMNGSTDYLEVYQYQFVTQNLVATASQTYFQAAMIRSA